MADLREALQRLYDYVNETMPKDMAPWNDDAFIAARLALAAEPTESLDVDRLAGKIKSADISLRDQWGRARSRSASYYRDMAESLLVLVNTHIAAARSRLAAAPTESLAAVYIPAFDLHTDLPNVLKWIDHLLGEHDCDHLGYESVMASRDRLRAWSQALRSEQDKK